MISMRSIYRKLLSIVPALVGTMLLLSCETDIEMINALDEHDEVPSVVAKNIEILYTENGDVKVKVTAPETRLYQFEEEPYNEFPQGITVFTYTDSFEIESQITAKYAVYFEEKQLWKAQYDVEAQNTKGEVLNTELLYWDEKNKKIYSDDMVKFSTEDGIIFGEGFESDENFDNWVIKKTSGTLYVEED